MSMLQQETWVRFGTNGIGLSDHQNRFRNGVRVGNWVENEYGDQLRKVLTRSHSFDETSLAPQPCIFLN